MVAAIAALLAGCQSWDYAQFVVPRSKADELRTALRRVAARHGMADRTSESTIPGTLVFFAEGDLSFTHLGARTHKDVILVDLIFRSAGLGGQLFKKLLPEVEQELQRLYSGSVRIERDREKMIAVPNT